MGLPTELVELTDAQRDLIDLCRTFGVREIRPIARAVDEADVETPWEVWRKAAEAGLTDFMLPAEHGGGGCVDVFTQCLVQEELGAADAAIGNLLTANGFFADPVLELGTPEQKERWLRPLTGPNPPMTALAVTEPGAGSDAASITTRATKVEGGYRLRGQKAWISNGGVARFYVVFATLDPALRSRGITAFLLDRDATHGDAVGEGLTFGQPMRKMGQRAIVNTEIFLDDVFVPAQDRLGDEGRGFSGLMRTFEISRTVLAASATGLARACLESATAYARERVQFGKPIIEHQAVAFRLADMAARIEAARLLTWRAAKRLDAGLPCAAESAMAKLSASETAMHCSWAAVQTLGGWGYSREHLAEKWMRDAKLEEIEEGTSDIQRLIIARNLP